MSAPAEFFRVKDAVPRPVIASLKVAVTFAVWLAIVELRAGALAVTVGATVSTVTARDPTERVSTPSGLNSPAVTVWRPLASTRFDVIE